MNLPISKAQAKKAANWLVQNFGEQIKEHLYGTPYDLELVSAIFCQETACKLLLWFDKYEPLEILARCVFDASGDFPNTTRNAFPKNKAEFKQQYGATITAMLIAEANKMRSMPQPGYPQGYSPADYLYKGYGLFQYDLQHIKTDPEFFLFKKWYNFSDCMQKLIEQLNTKFKHSDTLRALVKSYNGSGAKAEEYADNVLQYKDWIV